MYVQGHIQREITQMWQNIKSWWVHLKDKWAFAALFLQFFCSCEIFNTTSCEKKNICLPNEHGVSIKTQDIFLT